MARSKQVHEAEIDRMVQESNVMRIINEPAVL